MKNVQNAHMDADLRDIHLAMMDLAGFLNRPQADDMLIREAGITLDRALFPLLVRIERKGPIGVVELADLAGRDHSVVSRQVAKLESLGLVERRPGATDKRVREAAVTDKGRELTDALDAARQRLAGPMLETWSAQDRKDLARLLRKFVDEATKALKG
ncbi:MarR family winged helix-turn-helix transcriptional regulator [Caulobacter sp. X]|uniref:MarR family winged helix-turn-helix transcriptional regulator n=1 Tax=Caulobacter sp. X TaxID=2048901 RepID=UPI000C14F9A4|nr:MarR family transcriptional regulator [Caulobacter sp. X]PIC01644.1 MarR family transcriptional regulator [Caulobacter sp. X]